ncbi:hypothetical protein GCM10009039_21260 [Halocalculus aciditolerans]|uniref:Uncharacterized protein n=1 Tax=Halocalculus aciditolerans TaxID=1383812 RepID=A0A830FL25_9EURY|nr:hypothetical protein GCM10009039_21260 [Halocalculus aciditolerans]
MVPAVEERDRVVVVEELLDRVPTDEARPADDEHGIHTESVRRARRKRTEQDGENEIERREAEAG